MKKTLNPKKDNKRTIRQIRIVAIFFVVLILAMSYYIADYAISNQVELISNSYNSHQRILAAKNIRGTIYSRNGESLVESSVNEAGVEVRNYKYGNLFAHSVGYATNGRMGVEAYANFYLINSNAPVSVKAANDAKGYKYPGDSVYTTLDLNLQKVAYDAMGMYKGAVIVTEPSTGRILAMVSKPDFDPASISEQWDSLVKDEESSVLLNRATQGIYAPGSTFKIVTALEYIREHPEDFNSYNYNCTGKITRGEDTIRCYHGTVHGQVDFTRSFAKSCNSSFANIGLELDKKGFEQTLNDLLFNQKLPTTLTASQSKLEVNSETPDTDMIQIVIGQGKAGITPLQLNMITCAIANDGVLMQPYLIDRVENTSGSVIKTFKSEKYGSLISKTEASIMQKLMEDVVQEGTGTKLKGQPYYAGGKTGSAEFGTVKGESHAWFTGYAGMSEEEESIPDICVTIIIESAGSGGEYAVPMAKRIFDAYYGLD